MMTARSDPEELRVFPDRARLVLRRLYGDYQEGRKLFSCISRADAPQTRLRPGQMEERSPAHYRWLFFAAMTDRRDLSENVYDGHRRLWEKKPEFYEAEFLPGRLPGLAAEEIEPYLAQERISMPRESALNWVKCSRTLFFVLGGDPTALYRGRSIDDILALKQGKGYHLPGFGPKILSLLALFYQELEAIAMPADAFPIDVHVQRFALSTGIVESKGKVRNAELEKILRPLFSQIAQEEGWPVMEVAHAIWFLGNRHCTGCSRNAVAEHYCSVYDLCGGAVPSRSYFKKGLWDLSLERYRKGGQLIFGLPEDAPLFLERGG